MKNLINTIALALTVFGCKAQSPVINITDYQNRASDIAGSYIKDTDNLLNIYEGTYLYTNGNDSLKVVLQKKTMSFDGKYYEDLIIGEYQYIKDGAEIINTLPKLSQMYSDQSLHSISGNQVLTGKEMGCFDCSPTEKRLVGGLVEQGKGLATFNVRTMTINGQEAIEFFFYWHYQTHKVGDPEPDNPSFPSGYYTMIKQ